MFSRNQARVIPTHVEQTTKTFSWHRHDATHSNARGTDFLTSPVSPAWLDSFPLALDNHKCAAVNFKNQLDSFPPMWDAS